ncbi:MAG TPA: hypothetical protein VLH94_04960 [Spirochaetia bacterium]|nr:hypothetical protein [Spirochaetia bacterium]
MKKVVYVLVLVAILMASMFSSVSADDGGTKTTPAWLPKCPRFEADVYDNAASLSELVADATGKLPSYMNTCFAIFVAEHGNITNVLFVKNGWALLNLPVEVFTPWQGDQYLVGGPTEVAALAVIDEDTIIVDGGVNNIYRGKNFVDTVDWSAVKGGIFQNEVRFESSRLNLINNSRVWNATCQGMKFSDLEQALACGRGE